MLFLLCKVEAVGLGDERNNEMVVRFAWQI